MPGIKYEVIVESLPIKLYHGTECDSCKKRVRVPDAKLGEYRLSGLKSRNLNLQEIK